MITLIKNEREWSKYRVQQELRAPNFIFIHSPAYPEKYPNLVLTTMSISGPKASMRHNFVYVEDAQKLITYANQSKRKKTSSRRV
jgi:hypothetical protein